MENSGSIADDDYDFLSHEETALNPEVVAQIRDWLQPTQYLAESGEFRRHLSSRAPNTGLWICETDAYRRWHDSADHGSLWIKGVPGAGKSVAAAAIIQHLRATEDCPVLFFFFRSIVASNFTPRALVRDWLAQLLAYSPKLQFALQPRLETSLDEISDHDLFQLFLDGVSCVPRVYCVGDALDEMAAETRPFLDRLNGIATFRPHSLKLLITSRPKHYQQSALRDSSILHISLQRRLVDADIVSYLHHRFDEAQLSDKGQKVKQQLIDMVARRSEGLFLHAKLTMDQVEPLLSTDSPVDVDALEESLPVGLEQMYNDVLAKQRDESGVAMEVQVLVLQAVTHASRPLRLSELASLLRFTFPDMIFAVSFKEVVSNCCGPLVEVLEDETLQVIHHSFTEFLCGDARSIITPTGISSSFPVINSDRAHKRLAIICLGYLQAGSLLLQDETSNDLSAVEPSIALAKPDHQIDLDEEHHKRTYLGLKEEQDPFDYREARLLHPFLGYAVENWSYHAGRFDEEDEELFAAVACFLKPDSLAFRRWLVLQWGSTSKTKESAEGIPTAIHIAAFAGLSNLCRRLIQQGSSVSTTDAQNRIPLHWAAANGHANVASLLIRHGSDPDAEDGRGFKPLHLAAKKNHSSVAKILLEAGGEPNTIKTKENHAGRLLGGERTTKGECAILYASQAGHTETIMTMLPFCKGEILEQLLCECCRFGRVDAVLSVLEESDVPADATYCGATALCLACHSASSKCVSALISRGADVCKTSKWKPRRTINGGGRPMDTAKAPLHHLVEVWGKKNNIECQAIFQVLIDAGADVEQLDGNGTTPLFLLCGPGGGRGPSHVPAIRALLDAGAELENKQGDGDKIMHQVLQRDHNLEVVHLLIQHGSDPNQRGWRGETALHRALNQMLSNARTSEITEAIVMYLLENGANPNLRDDYGVTAVPRGMSAGPAIFRTLLARCNDDSVKSQCWFRLPEESNMERFVTYLEMLLAEGVDIDSRRGDGRTLYLSCLGSEEQLRVLRQYGAKADVADSDGNNALHILCGDHICTRDRLERFLAHGVDPLAVNNNGDALLHRVSLWYNGHQSKAVDLVRWLVSLGIPINALNNVGLSALHLSQMAVPRGTINLSPEAEHVHFIDAINGGGNVIFELRNNDGLAPLHTAAGGAGAGGAGRRAAGADPMFPTRDLQNILHLACRSRRPSLAGQILERLGPGHLDYKDLFGRTPLHYACSSGDAESVAHLLKHGADIHAVDSLGCTPLQACAQFRLEQIFWDMEGRRYPWLREPDSDPLRPCDDRHLAPRTIRRLLHRCEYDDESTSRVQRDFVPSVGTIVEMLLEAGCDAAVADDEGFTAIQVALRIRCTEFIEVFANDDYLFLRATRNLGRCKEAVEPAEQIRQSMRAQIRLLQPRSALGMLGQDKPAFAQVLSSPCRYLDILTWADAAQLINDGFEAGPVDATSYHTVLERLMQSSHIRVIEQVSRLVLHYSTHMSVRDTMQRARTSRDGSHDSLPTLTELQLACERPERNMLVLQHLVEKLEVDVNAQRAALDGAAHDPAAGIIPGGTAIHLLASAENHWQLDGMRYLLAHGADANAFDANGQSPLHIAACGMWTDCRRTHGFWRTTAVNILLDHGADPDLLDKKGLSPLHKASAAPDITRELLRRGANAAVGVESPLFKAIHSQSLATLEILLDHGISVNSVDERSHSRNVHYSLTEPRKVYALLRAAFAGHPNLSIRGSVPLLRALVERGADLYVPLNDDETLIHFLFQFPKHEVLDALLQDPCVSRIDFNHRDQHGRTVLMAACDWREALPGYYHRHWDPPALGPPLRVLDHKTKATLIDSDGKTALHHLLDNPGLPDDVLLQFIDREEVASTLLSKDKGGYSPLHYALRILRPAVCESLLSKGAQLLEPDPNGLTALHYIATQWHANDRATLAPERLDIELPRDHLDGSLALWR